MPERPKGIGKDFLDLVLAEETKEKPPAIQAAGLTGPAPRTDSPEPAPSGPALKGEAFLSLPAKLALAGIRDIAGLAGGAVSGVAGAVRDPRAALGKATEYVKRSGREAAFEGFLRGLPEEQKRLIEETMEGAGLRRRTPEGDVERTLAGRLVRAPLQELAEQEFGGLAELIARPEQIAEHPVLSALKAAPILDVIAPAGMAVRSAMTKPAAVAARTAATKGAEQLLFRDVGDPLRELGELVFPKRGPLPATARGGPEARLVQRGPTPGDLAGAAERRAQQLAAATPAPEETASAAARAVSGGIGVDLQESAGRVSSEMASALRDLEGLREAARITLPEAETIAKTGTLPGPPSSKGPGPRLELREVGAKPETANFQFSQVDIETSKARIVAVADGIAGDLKRLRSEGDALSSNAASQIQARIDRAVQMANKEARQFRKLRFAAGRAVKAFDHPIVNEETLQLLREAGVMSEGLRAVKARLPIYEEIGRKFREWGKLSHRERWALAGDFQEAFRLNIFPIFSFARDLFTNALEVGAQAVGTAGEDVARVVSGKLDFANTRGWLQALGHRTQDLPESITDELANKTAAGEQVRAGFLGKRGTFLTRKTPVRTTVDYLAGTPLYLKGLVDTSFGRVAASASLWSDAIKEANKRGLRGNARRTLQDGYLAQPPREALDRAISRGKKAKFDRNLSRLEEGLAGSPWVKAVFSMFPRWGFQYTRTIGEWLGANPELLGKLFTGKATGEEIAGYITKTASGWGGLYLVNKTMYDRTDFNTMEYVHASGERTRLAGLSPVPEALFLTALMKGDVDRATGALQHVSFPGLNFLGGEGGLVTSFARQIQIAAQNADVDPRGVQKETTDMVRRAVPGQALLSAMETMMNPTLQEGPLASLPGLSYLAPTRADPTTGKPMLRMQRIPGVGLRLPAVGGTAIPGARIESSSVEQALSRHGLLVNRGARSPVAGVPVSKIDAALEREYREELGKQRAQTIEPMLPAVEALESISPDMGRDLLKQLDADAARQARDTVGLRKGKVLKPPREESSRERRRPVAFTEPARQAREMFDPATILGKAMEGGGAPAAPTKRPGPAMAKAISDTANLAPSDRMTELLRRSKEEGFPLTANDLIALGIPEEDVMRRSRAGVSE